MSSVEAEATDEDKSPVDIVEASLLSMSLVDRIPCSARLLIFARSVDKSVASDVSILRGSV